MLYLKSYFRYFGRWTSVGHDQGHTVKHSVRVFRELFDTEEVRQVIGGGILVNHYEYFIHVICL